MSRVIHGLCVGATVILLASCGAPAPASVQVREQEPAGQSTCVVATGSTSFWKVIRRRAMLGSRLTAIPP
jgi:hypothetical protein